MEQGGNGELVFSGYRVSVLLDEKEMLERDGGDDYATTCFFMMLLN